MHYFWHGKKIFMAKSVVLMFLQHSPFIKALIQHNWFNHVFYDLTLIQNGAQYFRRASFKLSVCRPVIV